ncbi:MAG TPA: hypothetical protein VFB06_31190 [Streptosporangiaceae bacterium]|nr:hypothetical protein [Streptosporangiaceae bacterium]
MDGLLPSIALSSAPPTGTGVPTPAALSSPLPNVPASGDLSAAADAHGDSATGPGDLRTAGVELVAFLVVAAALMLLATRAVPWRRRKPRPQQLVAVAVAGAGTGTGPGRRPKARGRGRARVSAAVVTEPMPPVAPPATPPPLTPPPATAPPVTPPLPPLRVEPLGQLGELGQPRKPRPPSGPSFPGEYLG